MKPLIVLEHDYSIGVDSIVAYWPGSNVMCVKIRGAVDIVVERRPPNLEISAVAC